MDKNIFFREATLRICGNLDIEQALYSTAELLREIMPADIIFLEYYDFDYGVMRTIAKADETGGYKLDLITPLKEESRKTAGITNLPGNRAVHIFGDPLNNSLSREMINFHNIKCSNIMVLLLNSGDEILGAAAIISRHEKFTEEQSDYVLLLKEPFIIAMSNALKHRELTKLKELLDDDNRFLHGELRRKSGDEIIGANYGLKEVMYQIEKVASLQSPVLLLGETGVGKDVIANAIHYSSSRSEGPFVSVNCGAIPETLIDSELFGYEKGAFTGAVSSKRGRFERADKGTIFLDEIGELPLQSQVKLLRVIQEKEIERIGGTKTISLDIRIIAATNRNLEKMVEKGEFRKDLWFRLNVFPITIPPLRKRKEDIPALLQHFITLKSKELKLPHIPGITPGAADFLTEYNWPGNVRELQNIVERALILNPAGPLSFKGLLSGFNSSSTISPPHTQENLARLDDVIAAHIRKALKQSAGKIHGPGGAADILGVNPNTLRHRMDKLGITYGKKMDGYNYL